MGLKNTSDIYLHRQKVALLEVFYEIEKAKCEVLEKLGDTQTSRAVIILLSLTFNRLISYGSKHSWWQPNGGFPASMFTKQAIAMTWNYVEIPVNSPGAAGWSSASSWIERVIKHLNLMPSAGLVWQGDAANLKLANESVDIVTIDPPYFDSIAYSYLSDVYYVWMQAYLGDLMPQSFKSLLSPKKDEAIVDRDHTLAPSPKTKDHFYTKMCQALTEIRRVLKPNGQLIVMYGHKDYQAWAAFLKSLIDSNLYPTVSYPVHTERKIKFRHGHTDALSSSCVMVCRKRPVCSRGSVSWDEFEQKLKESIRTWLARFRLAHVEGVDLMTSIIAPVVSLFVEYEEVLNGGHIIDLEELLRRLPKIVAECDKEILIVESEILENIEVRSLLKSIAYKNQVDNEASWLDGKSDFDVINQIAQYTKLLQQGNGEAADSIWKAMSEEDQHLAQLYLRAIVAVTSQGAKDRQLANTSLGRINYSIVS